MRNIRDYEKKYQTEPCEEYQVKYRRKQILQLLGKYNHRNMLEIGCGMEPLFEHCQDYEQMVIVEPAETFVNNAIQKVNGRNVTCIQGFFEDSVKKILSLDISFDYIVLSSLLHEVEDPEKLLETVREVCSEQTVLHINVPNANSVHRLLAKEMGLIEDVHELSALQKTMQRKRVFDTDTLEEFVEKCGFEVLEKGTYFPKFLSAGQMERMLAEGIVKDDIFEGLDKMIKYMPDLGSEIYVQVRKK